MSISPVELTASQRIGSVEFVAPNEIKVQLDLEAPDGIAANAGILPRSFPRINSYVLIASDSGFIVAQVEWIAVERSPFPKRKGFQDFGLIDLPFPLRKLRANPIGVLYKKDSETIEFKRGVQAFPSVGEPVLIPTDNQLKAIVESGENRYVKIGTSPLAADAEVKIDPDRLFGRHLAVLGNTGSGKSCSVAGMIQWCLNEAKSKLGDTSPNARFIILDPNGEYSRVFNTDSKHKANIFKIDDENTTLKIPMWLWNSAEWCSTTQAKPGIQAPLLRQSLRRLRNEEYEVEPQIDREIKRFLGNILTAINHDKNVGNPFLGFPNSKNFLDKVKKWFESVNAYQGRITDQKLDELAGKFDDYIQARSDKYPTYESSVDEIDGIISEIENAFLTFGGNPDNACLPKNEDTPIQFKAEDLVKILDSLAQESGNLQHVDYLLARIASLVGDSRMKNIIGDHIDITLDQWLSDHIGSDSNETNITLIDLSLVPSEIIHIITAVISRMVFEALQRYRKTHSEKKTLPTVLVAEEAHTFIKRYKDDAENQNTATICTQVFERIAREGRKFGLGLLLSSQRPSELSPTVLSQCNSFLLHRLSNDRDQDQVNRLVPDNLRGLLRELPTLPSQHAILMGWASELPVLVRMNDLAKDERPHSDDPDFWNVWTRQADREVDWKTIADDWQMKETNEQTEIPPDTFDDLDLDSMFGED